MVHLKNSNYTPKDAQIVLSDSRDLSYGVHSTIRDCRISSKFIEFDISIPKEQIEKNQSIKDGIFYFNNERFWESHEALEGAWKQCIGGEKELIQGIILVAAAFVHYQKYENKICLSVLSRALKKLHDKPGEYHDVNVDSIKQNLLEMLDKKEITIFTI